MADPVSIGAAVGWGVSALGWLASPIISRVLNKGFAHLDFDATAKLKILDIQVLQLQRIMEVVDESTYRVHLEPLLNKLRSALYEAEDILDDFDYERLEKQIHVGSSSTRKRKIDSLEKNHRSAMPSSSLKDKGIGTSKVELKKSLEKIENTINDACKVLEQLNLPSVCNDNGRRGVATNSRSAVTTAGPPLRVIGRDQDRDRIIAMLHEKDDRCQVNGTSYSVIGIHGVAGSGKSTLAQYVYDHEKKCKQGKREGYFDVLMWIHVSQKIGLESSFRDMFEGATGKACPNFNSLNVLKENLEEELRGKRIFLVLDDVWYNSKNSGDREELQKLISPLNVGKAGSRILVTSRTEAALLALRAAKEGCIPISNLDDKVFLKMFMHYALPHAWPVGNDRRKLEMIGEDIAKKLKGSPLAARIVGSRLGDNPNVEFWRREKDRDLMNETMGALWWSYQYLDEQVRRCFAYISIFPRRHHLKRNDLINLWVAEGFIKTSKAEEEMEDVASEYFDELLSFSFLQLGGKDELFAREVNYFIIHDLLYDLAEEVAGRDCFRIEKGFTGEVPPDVRYLFVGTYDKEMLTEKISRLQNLRTLFVDKYIQILSPKYDDFVSMVTMLMGLRKLRVLNLHFTGYGIPKFSLPDSILQWKHLRYFAFGVSPFTKLTLPCAFTKLYHLHVVDFGDCDSLEFSRGEYMMNLVNLRHVFYKNYLDFPNIGRLTWLQSLPCFRIRKKHGYESHQLKYLNKLQGRLYIGGLQNVESKEEALNANLAAKEKLCKLILSWDDDSCSPEVQTEVLEGLCPSKYLEILEIKFYTGMKFPNWMASKHKGGPKNLQELRFVLSKLGSAPDVGAFIHLQSLFIYKCSWDTLPGNMEHLTALKKLEIRSCNNIRSLPTLPKSLEQFVISYCSLDALPGNMEHLTALKKLEILACNNIRSLPTLPKSLEEFIVRNCTSSEFMQSCMTTNDPNWQKIEHVPNKRIGF
ncbi:putative disease resistance RPP13-like protein 1 [Hordeum vulgare]|nr:putative disease resistance RPP13-like protein 1 [Hordeum vulgare]